MFTLLLILASTPTVFGFGPDEHKIVGEIAEIHLQGSPAAAKVKSILNNETLASVSIWADRVKGGSFNDESK